MTGDVNVRVGIDDGPFVAGLRRLSDQMASSSTELASRFAIAERAYDTARAALEASIGAAIEAEVVEQRLTAALRQRGLETAVVVERLKAYNSALSTVTGVGDEQLTTIQSTLVALGAETSELERATAATLGLAEITGKGYAEAARTVIKVLAGKTEALRELGIQVTGTNAAMDLLAGKAQLVADRAETTQGRITKLTNSLGELGEAVGNIVLGKNGDAPGWFDRVVSKANQATLGLTRYVEETGLLGTYLTAQSWMVPGAQAGLLWWLQSVGEEAEQAAKSLATVSNGQADLAGMGRTALAPMGLTKQDLAEGEAARKARAVAAARASDDAWQARLADYTPGPSASPGDRGFVGPVDPDTQQFLLADQAARQAAQAQEIADLQSHQATLHAIEVEGNEARFQAQLDAYDAIQAKAAEHNAAVQATANAGYSGMMTAVTGFAAGFAQVAGQAMAGRVKFGEALKQLAGESIVQIGQMLFQLGTAGVLAGTLGTVIPFFATLTGGPLGVAAGSAAAAAGLGMILLGSALGASSSSAPSAPSGSVGGGRAGGGRASATSTPASDLFPRSSLFGGVGEGQGTQFVMNVYGGFFGGDSRGVARDLDDVITEGRSRLPKRRRGLAA